MSMLKRLQAEWKTMTAAQKINMVLDIMISIGGGAIGGSIAGKTSVGRNKLEKACLCVTGIGLGMAIGEAAQKPVDELCDAADKIIKFRKKTKEGEANA